TRDGQQRAGVVHREYRARRLADRRNRLGESRTSSSDGRRAGVDGEADGQTASVVRARAQCPQQRLEHGELEVHGHALAQEQGRNAAVVTRGAQTRGDVVDGEVGDHEGDVIGRDAQTYEPVTLVALCV